ncbi:hypothetical protein DIPPA_28190 [Diplonema papillatum]|nr:hypothetical protein DIPPA_28190 [Diplonema papillatum]
MLRTADVLPNEVDGVYKVPVDAQGFSAVLHWTRFGDNAVVGHATESSCQEAARFLGLGDRLLDAATAARARVTQAATAAADSGRAKFAELLRDFDSQIRGNENEISDKTNHHTRFRNDGHGRIYCTSCHDREIDSRFGEGDKYTLCGRCSKQILAHDDWHGAEYGYCHKCKLCTRCQVSGCSADPPTLAREKEALMDRCLQQLGDLSSSFKLRLALNSL